MSPASTHLNLKLRCELSCDEVEALLPLIADGGAAGAPEQNNDPALFAHLATCDRCQASLAAYDLIDVALVQSVTVKPASVRVLRPRWARPAPLAAALAATLMLSGGWLTLGTTTRPSPPTVAARSMPIPGPVTVAAASPPTIDIEIVTMPGSTAAHPHYLIRRGEQVMLVSPPSIQAEAPSSARQASYSPNRY